MDSVTESIVVQLQVEQPKGKKIKQPVSNKYMTKQPVVKQDSSEKEDSDLPIIEFTAVSP